MKTLANKSKAKVSLSKTLHEIRQGGGYLKRSNHRFKTT